jgi:hypothetical protein
MLALANSSLPVPCDILNTSLPRSQESSDAAEAANAHALQRYPDTVSGSLVPCSSHSYSGSFRALTLSELHSLFHQQ